MHKLCITIALLLAPSALWAQQYTISTIAGDEPIFGFRALEFRFRGVATDFAGNVYFSDSFSFSSDSSHRIWKRSPDGMITSVAGNGIPGYSGDGGPATGAQLNSPFGVAVDAAGNLYIGDDGNNRVRKVSINGIITTIAGNGVAGYSGDGGLAITAQLYGPMSVAVDTAGNVYIADAANSRIRKVSTGGIITTIAGKGGYAFSGDGGAAINAEFSFPVGVAVDGAGNVYVADSCAIDLCSYRIRKISVAGIITTIAGNGGGGFSGDGGLAVNAEIGELEGVTVDGNGSVFIPDTTNNRIRKVSPDGIITTIAGNGIAGYSGDGGLATNAQLKNPTGVAVDTAGNLYIADFGNGRIRKVSRLSAFPYSGQAVSANGGSGSINFAFPAGVAWTASTTANWITFKGPASGTGSGTISYQVISNPGAARTATITVGNFSFTVEQQAGSIPGLSLIGSMPHIVAGGDWSTTFTLVNKGVVPAQARMSLLNNRADPLMLPLGFPQLPNPPLPLLAASFDRTLAANASLIFETAGPQAQPAMVGSAEVAAVGPVDGFAIFHWMPGGQEVAVPLETRNASSYLLAFDNTGGATLGVAVKNVSTQAATIYVVIRDDTGALIGGVLGGTISLAGNGHTSFMLSLQYPVTANKRGTIEFDTPLGGQISVLGIRGGGNALAGIPSLANVGTNGGSIAHIATGNGWQTTFVLVNAGGTAAQAQLKFFADNGSPLSLPLAYPQSGGGSTVASTVDQTVAAGATLIVQSSAPLSDPAPTTGSAQLTTTGNVGGFAILRYNPTGQEVIVPLENRVAYSYVVAFDNTNGTATGIAVNTVSTGTSIAVDIRDDSGAVIGTDQLNLPANGHLAFMLGTDKYPATAGIRGTIEFGSPFPGEIGTVGIRAPVGQAFTTLPTLVK